MSGEKEIESGPVKGKVVCVNNPPGIASLIEKILPHGEDIARIAQTWTETTEVTRSTSVQTTETNKDGLPLPTQGELVELYSFLLGRARSLDETAESYGCAEFVGEDGELLYKSGRFIDENGFVELARCDEIWDETADRYPRLKRGTTKKFYDLEICCTSIGSEVSEPCPSNEENES